MYHHFCDFFNLYISLFIEENYLFQTDNQVVVVVIVVVVVVSCPTEIAKVKTLLFTFLLSIRFIIRFTIITNGTKFSPMEHIEIVNAR